MAFASSVTRVDFVNIQQHGALFHANRHRFPNFSSLNLRKLERKIRVGSQITNARRVVEPEVDINDPEWKKHFQEDFDRRFNLPHLKNILDIKPRLTTFSLKSRRPIDEDNGAKNEDWNGYVDDDDRALLKVIKFASPTSAGAEYIDPDCSWVEQWVHRAGPRKQIYFEPREVKAAIVTCGGLCPGLNDVIRQIVLTLEIYGVKNIVGIPYGYHGFTDPRLSEVPLSCQAVQNINLSGGSFLGVSRGSPTTSNIVDRIQAKGIDMLFVLGGDGTHAGALAIHNESNRAYWTRSMNSRSIPSSPSSVYSLPASFEKFSIEVKKHARAKGVEKSALSRVSLLEKAAASMLKVTSAGRKPTAGNFLANFAPTIQLGPKALRKSWGGNLDTRGRHTSTSKSGKPAAKSESRSASAPRQKSSKNEKSLAKEDSKLKTPAKKMIANGGEDSDKATKQSHVSKKPSETSNSLSNLVKVETTKRNWTDDSISWQSLPSSLAKLGKELLKYRDAAQQAAVEAMQKERCGLQCFQKKNSTI